MLITAATTIVLAMILAIPVSSVFASDWVRQSDRPPINPDFAPDESCLTDLWQSKCTPGSEQDCPEGFGGDAYAMCYPRHDVCPEGYHGEEGDESGQCLPNDEGCHGDYVMNDEENYCYDPTT